MKESKQYLEKVKPRLPEIKKWIDEKLHKREIEKRLEFLGTVEGVETP